MDFHRKVLSVREREELMIAEVAERFGVGVATVVRCKPLSALFSGLSWMSLKGGVGAVASETSAYLYDIK